MANTAAQVEGKVIQVAGPAVDIQFPEGQIPMIYTAIRITSEGFDSPDPIDIICEVQQHIGEGRVALLHVCFQKAPLHVIVEKCETLADLTAAFVVQ